MNFNKVVDINISEVNEQNFISQLHGIEVAKIDKILAKENELSNKPTEESSKAETQTPDLSGLDKDELKIKSNNTQQVSESINLSMSEASEV